ncbi:MAG: acetyl-CoA carboxylase biotin carboxyl carrier protein subunit [Opitutales bacterium]|nr:acetyl-CoA carboxylase biotin carboxyl carrier protein subunit [Opitutales bacterium]
MRKQFRITVNGKSYDVVAEIINEGASAPASAAAVGSASVAAPAAPKPAAPAGGEAGAVPCPLAGRVVAIDKPVGSSVQAGETLITLEAMKMNTTVSSPAAGTVKAVHVSVGDSVEEGQILVTLG